MKRTELPALIWLCTTAALAGLVWGIVAVIVASVAPPQYIPRIFFSYHIEHFAVFYLIAVLAAVGLPAIRLYQLGFSLVLMALVLATARLAIPRHRLSDAEDLAADVAGVAAALGPMVLGRLRYIAAQRRKP
jgi:hypothetical protein